MGAFTKESTDTNFETDVINSKTAVLVDFWAEWCPPCKAIAPVLEEIAQEMSGKVEIVKINIDENPQTPAKFSVVSIPTLILFKDGRQVEKMIGRHAKESIVGLITKHL